jgi:hypothetical protein
VLNGIAAALMVLMAYPMSLGPVLWAIDQGVLRGRTSMRVVDVAYRPVFQTMLRGDTGGVQDAYQAYLSLFVSDRFWEKLGYDFDV